MARRVFGIKHSGLGGVGGSGPLRRRSITVLAEGGMARSLQVQVLVLVLVLQLWAAGTVTDVQVEM